MIRKITQGKERHFIMMKKVNTSGRYIPYNPHHHSVTDIHLNGATKFMKQNLTKCKIHNSRIIENQSMLRDLNSPIINLTCHL